ncbi:E3 ubiquitin-protein ligase MARCH6 [Apostasia shenzhenica]|uniref:E3 ubiquitin-protein ligase MARCH6 n=1 Tax=Apostasia shenzhenica TaxID=1088818 RepID=A0A2I0AUS3_9ASPA|nr:E3 ubiquitin-protein ligase MARCH6 [Apostasia shenzhenica]
MVGDFMECVDRFVASAFFDAGNNVVGGAGGRYSAPAVLEGGVRGEEGSSEGWREGEKYTSGNKKMARVEEVVECRICQEEGNESDMESPCCCIGTIKFAHRKCIQRWCNKKGSITCEICNKAYAPNYSASPSQPASDVLSIDIRENWDTRIDLHDSNFLAIAAAEQELFHAEYEEYAAAHHSGIACCRAVALTLIFLVCVRHILMVTSDLMMVQDIATFISVFLQFASFLLPCYVIACLFYILHSSRRRQSWL